jgi:hypothetical protein
MTTWTFHHFNGFLNYTSVFTIFIKQSWTNSFNLSFSFECGNSCVEGRDDKILMLLQEEKCHGCKTVWLCWLHLSHRAWNKGYTMSFHALILTSKLTVTVCEEDGSNCDYHKWNIFVVICNTDTSPRLFTSLWRS